jgi:predicted RNA-binding protein
MKRTLLVITLLFSLVLVQSGPAVAFQLGSGPIQQESSTLSPEGEKVRKQVEKVGLGKTATVIMSDEREFYGSIKSIEADEFLFYEVDSKQLMTIRYDEVKKVRKGYGDRNYVTGKRVRPSKALIGAIAGAAAILVPVTIILVALSREN